MISQDKFKCQEIDTKKGFISLSLHKDLILKDLIEEKKDLIEEKEVKMPAKKSGLPCKRGQKTLYRDCIVREERIKCQDYRVKNKISSLIFYKRFLPRHLIDGKLYVQVSPDDIIKFFKKEYSTHQIKRSLRRLVKEGILVIRKSIRRNEKYYFTLNDVWYNWTYNEALKNPNNTISDFIADIIEKVPHDQLIKYQEVKITSPIKEKVPHDQSINFQRVSSSSHRNRKVPHDISEKVSKPQEVKESGTVDREILRISKKNVNETSSSSFSNYYQLSRVPKSEEDLRKRLSNCLTPKQMQISLAHFRFNHTPEKEFGYYYDAGTKEWKLPITKETIAQENKQIGYSIAKKLILRDGEQLEILNTYLEFITGGTHNIPISYDDRNFLEKIENHLKKRNYSLLEELGIITNAA